jgi:hypothetical protein
MSGMKNAGGGLETLARFWGSGSIVLLFAIAQTTCAAEVAPEHAGTERSATVHEAPESPRLPEARLPNGARSALIDGDLLIDCGPTRAQVAARRAQAQVPFNGDAEAELLFAEAPHQYIPPELLVEFMLPQVGAGRPVDPGRLQEVKTIARMMLCDKFTREVLSRQFAAANPTYR